MKAPKKKKHPKIKFELHPRNKHRGRYDLKALAESSPELSEYIIVNKFDDESIDFFDPEAVLALNTALLKHYYDIDYWNIPRSYLCPPIPGRADYIHHIADVLAKNNKGVVPMANGIKCLDIGVGANCVYPIIGVKEYDWSFVASDIDSLSIESAQEIVDSNPNLKDKVELRLQDDPSNIFKGIIKEDEKIDLSICNPPFHSSKEEAEKGSEQKLTNLKKGKIGNIVLNFGGQSNELWYEGGELKFISKMIVESKEYSSSCFLFSTLVSKKYNLNAIYAELEKVEALDVKTIPIGQGNKRSRIVSWTFLSKEQQQDWIDERWK